MGDLKNFIYRGKAGCEHIYTTYSEAFSIYYNIIICTIINNFIYSFDNYLNTLTLSMKILLGAVFKLLKITIIIYYNNYFIKLLPIVDSEITILYQIFIICMYILYIHYTSYDVKACNMNN